MNWERKYCYSPKIGHNILQITSSCGKFVKIVVLDKKHGNAVFSHKEILRMDAQSYSKKDIKKAIMIKQVFPGSEIIRAPKGLNNFEKTNLKIKLVGKR